MTAGQAVGVPKKRKGMLGFYVGTGAVALLLVGFYFAWTPLRVWYWEREVRKHIPMVETRSVNSPQEKAVNSLVSVGPGARSAVDRLFSEDDITLNSYLLKALRRHECTWILPALVARVRANNPFGEPDLTETIGEMSGVDFEEGLGLVSAGPPATVNWTEDDFATLRLRVLDWWEKEGKAKYGRGGG